MLEAKVLYSVKEMGARMSSDENDEEGVSNLSLYRGWFYSALCQG